MKTPLICAGLGLLCAYAGFQSDQLAWPQVAMALSGYLFAGAIVFSQREDTHDQERPTTD